MEEGDEILSAHSSWTVRTPGEENGAAEGPSNYELPVGCVKVHFKELQFDYETMINYESCCKLVRSEAETPEESLKGCTISFNLLDQKYAVAKLVLVSECRRVEVFGFNDEYIETREGTILDDSDDEMVPFQITLDLKKHRLKNFKMKLTSLGKVCWILALHLEVQLSDAQSQSFFKPRFDLNEVNQLLGTTDGSNLSEKAKEFKKLFENFQNSPPSMMMMHANPSELLQEGFRQLNNAHTKSSPITLNGDGQGKIHSDGPHVCKCECSNRLVEMEERLVRKIEEERRINTEKMDLILSLLEDAKNNFKM